MAQVYTVISTHKGLTTKSSQEVELKPFLCLTVAPWRYSYNDMWRYSYVHT